MGDIEKPTVVNGDARELPFEDDQFDAIVSVDAFDTSVRMCAPLPGLPRVLRSGGVLGMTIPALRQDPYAGTPPAYVTHLIG